MGAATFLALTATLALLCGCSPDHPPHPAAAATSSPTGAAATITRTSTYTAARYGFAIKVPTSMQLRHDFQRSYLGDASWKAYAGADSHGTPVVALVLDGSNAITAAELRIGIGTDDNALAHCTDVPATGVSPATDTVTLDGVPFTHFHAADAAMSHYQDVDAYRAVHAGRCYAIDLLLTGTRPEVYDPPATPPFTQADARQRLHAVLGSFRWLH